MSHSTPMKNCTSALRIVSSKSVVVLKAFCAIIISAFCEVGGLSASLDNCELLESTLCGDSLVLSLEEVLCFEVLADGLGLDLSP